MTASPADNLSIAQQVDSACDEFEAAFIAGKRPQLESYLGQSAEPSRLQLFRGLLELELELRRRAGELPQRDEYVRRFPDYAAVTELVFADVSAGTSRRSQSRTMAQDSSVKASVADTSKGPDAAATQGVASPPPNEIGRFQILQQLGKGAFGAVYHARDPQLDREVAIKVPRSGALSTQEERDRFLREARAAAGLHHPHICPVHEVGTTPDGRDYIVMAFIEGKTLSKVLQSGQQLSGRQIAGAIRKIALALEEAHEKGVIHRDLKPANIMINRKGEPVIMDFGLARRASSVDPQLSHTGQIMGTPAYMSPEQARGDSKALGPGTDIYSLGIVMYELLCGKRPFNGTVTEVLGQILHVDAPPPTQYRPEVDPRLQEICIKAIAKQPKDRYASMKDFAAALTDYVKSGTAAIPTTSATTAEPPAADEPLHTKQLARLVAAVSSDVEDKVERAARRVVRQVKKSKGPKPPPFWAYLAGSGLIGVIVLLGILFFVRSGDATIIVQVQLPEGIQLTDETLAFFLDDKPITAEELGTPVELQPGEHVLLVRRGDVDLKRMTFSVGLKGWEPAFEIKRVVTLEQPSEWIDLSSSRDLSKWVAIDGKAPQWKAEDGYLEVVPGTRSIMTRDNLPLDFELHLEFWLPDERPKPGQRANSGVFLHGRHEIQICDSFENNTIPNPAGVCASLYGEVAPTANACTPPETWQSFDIVYRSPRANGQGQVTTPGRLTLTHNGQIVIKDATFTSVGTMGRRDERVGQPGPLVMQDHGSPVRFRNIRYKPLVNQSAAKGAGFVPLFNGHDLSGWTLESGDTANWKVQDGAIVGIGDSGVPRSGAETWLLSDKNYQDFVLRFEFQTASETVNSGFGFRAVPSEKPNATYPVPSHLQVEIFDNAANRTNPVLKTGAVLGSLTPPVVIPSYPGDTQKPVNEWNLMEIEARGQAIRVRINGSDLVDGSLDHLIARGGKYPGLTRTSGRIGFQRLRGTIRFRNIQIQELDPPENQGFQSLFTGDSLTGWQGQLDLWSLRGGVLTGQPNTGQSNTFLFSPRPYADFELRFQTRIGDADNSGVQIRSEVLDPLKWKARGPQADIGNRQGDFWGGVYAEGMPGGWMLQPAAAPPVKPNDWNDYFIRCVGKRVTIQVNGVTTVDGDIETMQATGLLAFQIHRSSQRPVEFRQIEIRELNQQQAGFVPLFNGTDLAGWNVVGPAQWTVRNGAVFVDGRKPGHLVCDQQFDNFELTGEVYADAKGNGAVCFHVSDAPTNGSLQRGGYEFQVAGSQGDPGGNYTGGLYADATPIATVRPPIVGDRVWGNIRIRVEGTHLQGWVNDKRTFDVQGQPARLAGRKLTLQSYAQGGEVGYRNLRIRPLNTAATASLPKAPRPAGVGPDRAAAEWVLNLGGKVEIESLNERRWIEKIADLPVGAFTLISVNLSNQPQLKDVDLSVLAGAQKLEGLNLNGTAITSSSIQQLSKLASLKYVNLCVPMLDDDDLKVIPGLTQLYALEISYTSVTDAGLEYLKPCRSLRTLYLTDTKTSKAGHTALQAALPNLQIDIGEKR